MPRTPKQPTGLNVGDRVTNGSRAATGEVTTVFPVSIIVRTDSGRDLRLERSKLKVLRGVI